MRHCSGVTTATADTANKAKGIDEEGMIVEETLDMETVKEFDYGETSFLDGGSSTLETKNFVGLVTVSKSSRS